MPKKLYPLAFISLFIFLLFFLGFVVSETFGIELPIIGKLSRAVPENNVIYIGTYDGTYGAFFQQKSDSKNENPFFGTFISSQTNSHELTFDFRKLKEKRELIRTESDLYDIADLKIYDDTALLSVILEMDTGVLINKVFSVNLSTGDSLDIWSVNVGSSKYAKNSGVVMFGDLYDNTHLILNMTDCYACEAEFYGVIVLNINTREEIYMEKIGNITINSKEGTFSYQKLTDVREPCGEDFLGHPNCDADGYWLVPKPMGPVYVEELP